MTTCVKCFSKRQMFAIRRRWTVGRLELYSIKHTMPSMVNGISYSCHARLSRSPSEVEHDRGEILLDQPELDSIRPSLTSCARNWKVVDLSLDISCAQVLHFRNTLFCKQHTMQASKYRPTREHSVLPHMTHCRQSRAFTTMKNQLLQVTMIVRGSKFNLN